MPECSPLHGGPSNVDDNLGFGGVVYRLDRPFGCYHDVTGENKYYLNLKGSSVLCSVNYHCICKALALVTLTLHMHDVDATWTDNGNEGARLRFSGVEGQYISIFSSNAMVFGEIEVFEDFATNLALGVLLLVPVLN